MKTNLNDVARSNLHARISSEALLAAISALSPHTAEGDAKDEDRVHMDPRDVSSDGASSLRRAEGGRRPSAEERGCFLG